MIGNGLFRLPHDSANHHSASHLDSPLGRLDRFPSPPSPLRATLFKRCASSSSVQLSMARGGVARRGKVAKASVGGWSGQRSPRFHVTGCAPLRADAIFSLAKSG